MRNFLFFVLRKVAKPFWRKGYGKTFPVFGKIFYSLYDYLGPSGTNLAQIGEFKVYFENRSGVGRHYFMRYSYEPSITNLLTDIIKEGMTVLDLGANIGIHALTAARQAGNTGKVYAFEPGQESLSLLQKNIEANHFSNIFIVPMAVSNIAGKQRLYLAETSMKHSLYDYAGKEYIEVDVTTVDDFVKNHSLTVDVVKMDVEGSETKALEGMKETISNNQNLKLIIEFVPMLIERCGSSPSQFLKMLMDIGFKVRFIDEKKDAMDLVTIDNIDNITQVARGEVATNLYCTR